MSAASQNRSQTIKDLSQMENESSLGEGPNLYIAHEPSRFGGPYGIFEAFCDEEFDDKLKEVGVPMQGVKALITLPGRGYLLERLKANLKVYAIKSGKFHPSWFDADLSYILAGLSEVLVADLEQDKCAHYADMEVDR